MTSVREPGYPVVQSIAIKAKKCILDNPTYGVKLMGTHDGVDYENKFKLSDFGEVLLEYEKTTPIEASTTFSLPAPILILRTNELNNVRIPSIVDKTNFIEFQIIINAKPQGALQLEGFISLIRALCNPKKEFVIWSKYGLVPRLVQDSRIHNGGEISEKLQNRILLKSVLVTFDCLGDKT
jgi:hypothetical protein